MTGLCWLAACWLGYFALHSVLAGLSAKRWVARRWPSLLPYYRLVFNLLAVVLLLPPLYLTFTLPGEPLWAWRGAWGWVANGLALAALAGFWYSLRLYDMGEFLGLRQWRAQHSRVEDQERFRISPLHRFVRHPWYALALVLLWTRDMPPALLLTALLVSGYFVLGSRLEERKLIAYHGAAYREYRRRVPALIPVPWRVLSRAEARRLEAQAGR
jgi:protein-S-isoprenylcysteine O-methyltransferase Ste14